jgi:hypothetical protein
VVLTISGNAREVESGNRTAAKARPVENPAHLQALWQFLDYWLISSVVLPLPRLGRTV